jgi:hypothetical protein
MSIRFDTADAITIEGRIYRPSLVAVPGSMPFHPHENIRMLLRGFPLDESLISKIYSQFSKKLLNAEVRPIHDLEATYYPRSLALTLVVNQRVEGSLPIQMLYKWEAKPLTSRTPLLSRGV